MTIPPLFALAIWRRNWTGWWSLFVVALVCPCIWANPRIFRAPDNGRSWMSKAVHGERIWLARDRRSVSESHRKVPPLIAVSSGLEMRPLGWGLWQLQAWPTLLGLVMVMGGKLRFLDRMVWLLSDRARKNL